MSRMNVSAHHGHVAVFFTFNVTFYVGKNLCLWSGSVMAQNTTGKGEEIVKFWLVWFSNNPNITAH